MTTPARVRTEEPNWEECMRLLAALPGMPISARVDTIELLLRNPSPGVRPRALRMGAALIPEERLVAFIRSEDDDVVRNAGLEILKLRGSASFSVAASLSRDEDWDVVLQAVLVLDHIRDPRAIEQLRPLLQHGDINVVQAAIVALGHLGDARTIADLLPFLHGDPWLQIAAIQALGDLRSPQGIPPLRAILPDMLLGTFAAEAIARIGGRDAWACLTSHWHSAGDQIDAESYVGLLAHVVEGLAADPPSDPALVASFIGKMEEPASASLRLSAARCLLGCGATGADRRALAILAEANEARADLPACLTRRRDLCDMLLRSPNPLREWGFLLFARHPHAAHPSAVAQAMREEDPPSCLEHVAEALRQLHDAEVVSATVGLYLSLPPANRGVLSPALKAHKAMLFGLLEERTDISGEEKLVLSSHVGVADGKIVSGVMALNAEARCAVIPQIVARKKVMLRLPWKKWVAEEPALYVPMLAEIAAESGLTELSDVIRPFLSEELPSLELIRAMGVLRDRGSVPELSRLVEQAPALHRAQAMESLGAIGGPQARKALSNAAKALESREARLAYRALARCGVEEDGSLFREAASNSDWVIRMCSAEFLARFPNTENLPALAALAADPVPAVAQKVQSGVEG